YFRIRLSCWFFAVREIMQILRESVLTLVLLGAAPAFAQVPSPNATTSEPTAGQRSPAETENANPTPSAPAIEDPRPASMLEELIASRLARFVDRKPEQAAVEAFYRERSFQPIWSANGVALPRTRSAGEYLARVAYQGLDSRDYPIPDFSRDMNEETAAVNELQFTASILKYARHASAGRVSFTRVSGSILYPAHAADPAQVLAQIFRTDEFSAVLLSFEPQHPGYKALKAQLAREMSGAQSRTSGTQPRSEGSGKHSKFENSRPHSDLVGKLVANLERWRWL